MAILSIGADGIDVKKLEEEIRQTVAQKRAQGQYNDDAVARAERYNLLTMKDDEDFMERYIFCLRQIIPVDTNDFEIVEKRAAFRPLLKLLKKVIWKLLKFYTFRLWSQQNQTNAILLGGIENLNRCHSRDRKALEARVEALEKELAELRKRNP